MIVTLRPSSGISNISAIGLQPSSTQYQTPTMQTTTTGKPALLLAVTSASAFFVPSQKITGTLRSLMYWWHHGCTSRQFPPPLLLGICSYFQFGLSGYGVSGLNTVAGSPVGRWSWNNMPGVRLR